MTNITYIALQNISSADPHSTPVESVLPKESQRDRSHVHTLHFNQESCRFPSRNHKHTGIHQLFPCRKNAFLTRKFFLFQLGRSLLWESFSNRKEPLPGDREELMAGKWSQHVPQNRVTPVWGRCRRQLLLASSQSQEKLSKGERLFCFPQTRVVAVWRRFGALPCCFHPSHIPEERGRAATNFFPDCRSLVWGRYRGFSLLLPFLPGLLGSGRGATASFPCLFPKLGTASWVWGGGNDRAGNQAWGGSLWSQFPAPLALKLPPLPSNWMAEQWFKS